MISPSQDEEYYAKLERLKEIRQKTIQFEKMKLGLKEVIEEINNEDNSLQDYQAEIEMLIQEKMAHVEELRLIHTDINTMENLAKQAKSSRLRLVESVRKMYNDISPLQDELNAMRAVIGIEPMAELENVPSPSELEDKTLDNFSTAVHENPDPSLMQVKVSNESPHLGKLHLEKPAIRQQQPPPMKSCQSCHQQIHRNAPICPLCKAKSRSRHPKKTRRKPDF